MNPGAGTATGEGRLADSVIAADLLVSAKTAVRNYAVALTEAATPDVRVIMRRHLDDVIELHEEITAYMMGKELYHPYDVSEQIRRDGQAAEAALGLS